MLVRHASVSRAAAQPIARAWRAAPASGAASQRRALHVVAMARVWRPDMNDVDRLSAGGAAKKRGTGSFHIPHRLNSDERPVYETAKKKGFLSVRGTGYRKGRKGHPLPNIWRQWCDAKGQPCIVVEQDASGGSKDVVVVDLAPLRASDLGWAVAACCSVAQAAGARRLGVSERPLDAVPFEAQPVSLLLSVEQMLGVADASAPAASLAASAAAPTPEQVAAAEQAVLQQGDAVRELKAAGGSNADPHVQAHVQELLQLKAQLQDLLDRAAAAEAAAASSSSVQQPQQSQDEAAAAAAAAAAARPPEGRAQGLEEDHPFARVAIWQLPVVPLFFEAETQHDRTAAKQLARDLTEALSKPVAMAGAR